MAVRIAELVRELATEGQIIPFKKLVRELAAEGLIVQAPPEPPPLPLALPEPEPEPPPALPEPRIPREQEMDCYRSVLAYLCAIHRQHRQRQWPRHVLNNVTEKLRRRQHRVERMRLMAAWEERQRLKRAARSSSNPSLLSQFSGGVR